MCVLAASAANARAAPGSDTTVAQSTFSAALGTYGAAFANCPAGRRVVGGGVGTTAADASIVSSDWLVSGPRDETGMTAETVDGDIARSWFGRVVNPAGAGGQAEIFTVFALCSASSDATIEQTTFNVGSREAGASAAVCPAGSRVMGGGVSPVTTADTGAIQVSGPLDETGVTATTSDGDIARSWYANVKSGVAATYRVFALCSASSDATIQQTIFHVGADAQGTATASCPAGKRVAGGGVSTTTGTADDRIGASGPVDETGMTANTTDGDVARGWRASIFSNNVTRDYKVFALCVTDAIGGGAGGGTTSLPGSSGPVAAFAGSPKSLRVSSKGRFAYPFIATPSSSGTIKLASTVAVKVGAHKRKLTLAAQTFTASANGRVKVAFNLSRSNLRALKRARSLRFTVIVALAGSTFKASLTLKAPR